jgi:nitrous oxide reductase accessory protein NosL
MKPLTLLAVLVLGAALSACSSSPEQASKLPVVKHAKLLDEAHKGD